jgi:hypothetical protein
MWVSFVAVQRQEKIGAGRKKIDEMGSNRRQS